ncbi:MAG TPA: Rieske (2Fe-2S) protein [Candidatus Obscuribacterales bacterium]
MIWAAAAVGGFATVLGMLATEVFKYLLGPKLDAGEQTAVLLRRQQLLAAEQRLAELRLERINNARIAIAKLSDLSEDKGQLFTDYFLQPAILYMTEDGSSIARSAVCTHLGCTIQPDLVDGKIYCPCHVSYFDLKTGKPLAGPAMYPLSEEPITIEGDTVYLVKPTAPIKIGPTQNPMTPV